MNAKQRYDEKNPLVTFRMKKKMLEALDKYVADNKEVKSRSYLISQIVSNFFIKENIIEVEYKYMYTKQSQEG